MKKILAAIAALFSHKVTVATEAPAANQTLITTNATPAEIAIEDVQKAIDIVNKVKAAVSSPIAVLITDIIPSSIDDTIRETLVTDLPVVAAGLSFLKDALSSDKSTALNQVLTHIKFSDNDNKKAFYHTLAAKVLTIVTNGSVSWSKALLAVEYVLKEAVLTGPDPAASTTEIKDTAVAVAEKVAPKAAPIVGEIADVATAIINESQSN